MNKINSLIISLLLFSYSQHMLLAASFQSTDSIHDAVRSYILANLSHDTEYKLQLAALDNRLQLPLCTNPLEIFTHSESIKAGRNSIGVKCNSTKKWTIYTSANIIIYKDVIVLTQAIPRGAVINSHHVQLKKNNIATLRSGFLTNPQAIINKLASRNLNIGTVINKSHFREPKLIKKGEKVYIKVNSPNLNITVTGIAMMDGIKNQNIRIRNITSQKIIQATVIKQGQVEIML
ncbi:MAG: flagellar basal body P-ring formation protein FlgA [Methylococcales bacterium]|nr:flagellar basal body P-ring formation protein FlgA [Methylococcales bacterium]